MIPSFGRGIIRRFGGNVSGMKKFAARDFEQVLKVCIALVIQLAIPNVHISVQSHVLNDSSQSQ